MINVPSEKDKKIIKYLGSEIIATKKQRFFGFVLTKIIFISVALLVAFFADFASFNVTYSLAIAVTIMLAIHVILLLYKQKTLGMLINGTQIISDGSKKLSVVRLVFWRLLLNWFLPFTPGIGLLAIFNYLNITGNSTNRCIHDELSNTVVIKIHS